MSPLGLFTVITPFATVHFAGEPSFADTHSSRLRPSNSTIASDGGASLVFPGVTTLGTGVHTSVSSGRGAFPFCCAWAGRVANTASASTVAASERVVMDGNIRAVARPAMLDPSARFLHFRPPLLRSASVTPTVALWLPILVSAVVVFILSSVINTLTPWHAADYRKLPNEDAVADSLRPHAIPPG